MRSMVGLVALLALGGCGGSGASLSEDFSTDTAAPVPLSRAQFMKDQLMAQVEPIADDRRALDRALEGHDAKTTSSAAFTLYSHVADLGAALNRTDIYDVARSITLLPAAQQAQKAYTDALYALSRADAEHMPATAEAASKAQEGFDAALNRWAAPFMPAGGAGTLPRM